MHEQVVGQIVVVGGTACVLEQVVEQIIVRGTALVLACVRERVYEQLAVGPRARR